MPNFDLVLRNCNLINENSISLSAINELESIMKIKSLKILIKKSLSLREAFILTYISS